MEADQGKNLIPAKGARKKSSKDNVHPGIKTSKVSASKKKVLNAETAQVLRDAEAGKNLTTHVDEDDLFKKLGIKLGKAKVYPRGHLNL